MLLRILLAALLLPASALADAGQEAPACEPDAALTQAAVELSLSGAVPDADALAQALERAGSDLPGVRAWLARADAEEGGISAYLVRRRAQADGDLVCGLAASERGELLLTAVRGGELSPLDADSTHVRGSLRAGFGHAELVVADADGALERLPVSDAQLRAGIPIAPELVRPAHVQLLARGAAGPRPLAERVLPARGGSRPASASDGADGADGADAWQRLQQLRSEAGLGSLREHRLLQQVARVHAQEVCRTGRVVHTLTAGHDPEQRLRDAGVQARRVGETIARATGAAAAFAALQRSPSHRMTLLERGFTDAGVGEAEHEGRTCLVVLLAAWPRFVGGAGAL